MGDTLWINREPGENPCCDDVSEQMGEPCVLVHGGQVDWVRHPATGEKLRVKGSGVANYPCPKCGAKVEARTMVLERDILVRDCPACHQFVFFQMPA